MRKEHCVRRAVSEVVAYKFRKQEARRGGWSFLEISTLYIVQGPVLCGDGNSECCKKREFWGRHEEQDGRRKIG